MPVRAVTFDLDDTLWCGRAVIATASAAFHASIAASAPSVAAAFPHQEFHVRMAKLRAQLPAHAHDFTFLRRRTLLECIAEAGKDDDIADPEQVVDAAFAAFLTARSRPQFFPGALELLTELEARGLVLGAVTNGNCEQKELPEAFQRAVKVFVSAESAGVAKPHAAIFAAAVDALGIQGRPADVVHVGDHYDCDVRGARAAGMRTVWVRADWTRADVLRTRPRGPLRPVDESADADDSADDEYPEADAIVKDVAGMRRVLDRWTSGDCEW